MIVSIQPVSAYAARTVDGQLLSRTNVRRPLRDTSWLPTAIDADRVRYSLRQPSTREQTAALAAFAEKTDALLQTIDTLQLPGRPRSGFRTASVSDPDAATAAAGDNARTGTFALATRQLSSAPSLQSRAYLETESAGLAAGTYRMTMTVGTTDYDVEMTLAGDETIDEAFTAIEQAVRAANAGVSTRRIEDERPLYDVRYDTLQQKTIALRITADDASAVSLSDESGILASTLGLGRMVAFSQQARYDFNARSGQSVTDTLSLDRGRLQLTLQSITGRPVTVTVAKGTEAAVGQVAGLVEQYNAYVSWLGDNQRSVDPSLRDSLDRTVRQHARALDAVGITVKTDGTLQIDDQLVDTLATNPAAVSQALTGSGSVLGDISALLAGVSRNGAAAYATSYPPDDPTNDLPRYI